MSSVPMSKLNLAITVLTFCTWIPDTCQGHERSEVVSGLRSFFSKFDQFSVTRADGDPKTFTFIKFDKTQVQKVDVITVIKPLIYQESISFGVNQRLSVFAESKVELDANESNFKDMNVYKGWSSLLVSLRERKSDLRSLFTLLTGVIYGTDLQLVEILEAGQNWREQRIKLHGIDCTEVTVDHECGTFSVAFSLEHKYALLQLRVQKSGEQKHKGEPLESSGISRYEKVFGYKTFDPDFKILDFESTSIRSKASGDDELYLDSKWKICESDSNKNISMYFRIPNDTLISLKGKDQLTAKWENGRIVLPFDTEFVSKLKDSKVLDDTSKTKTLATDPRFLVIGLLGTLTLFSYFSCSRKKA